eukprot:SAG31_NODE_455_length_15433_cov_4.248728_2_plen_481_part_00
MLRKLVLVGFMVLVKRGSATQCALACVLSFMFFAAHVKAWPYKMQADNILKTTTEMQIFFTVLVALLTKNELMSPDTKEAYDWVLFFLFLLLVPFTFFVTVTWKIINMHFALSERHFDLMKHPDAWRAYRKNKMALCSDIDNKNLLDWTEKMHEQYSQSQKIRQLDTRLNHQVWQIKTNVIEDVAIVDSSPRDDAVANGKDADKSMERSVSISNTMYSQNSPVQSQPPEKEHAEEDTIYTKYTQGFDLVVGNRTDFYGGLQGLIGDCRKDVAEAMKEEHCDVKECEKCDQRKLGSTATGWEWAAANKRHVDMDCTESECTCFGASDTEFITSNYHIKTTAKKEWTVVLQPEENVASLVQETHKRAWQTTLPELFQEAASRMNEKFGMKMMKDSETSKESRPCTSPKCPICGDDGLASRSSSNITCSSCTGLSNDAYSAEFMLVELIGLRLYTGNNTQSRLFSSGPVLTRRTAYMNPRAYV